jgi:hypothetical protein
MKAIIKRTIFGLFLLGSISSYANEILKLEIKKVSVSSIECDFDFNCKVVYQKYDWWGELEEPFEQKISFELSETLGNSTFENKTTNVLFLDGEILGLSYLSQYKIA